MNRTPGIYEARGTLVVTPPQAELHQANQNGDSLVSRRICDCADGVVLRGRDLREAEDNARFIAHACNLHDDLVSWLKTALWHYEAFRDSSPVGDTERNDIANLKKFIALAEGR